MQSSIQNYFIIPSVFMHVFYMLSHTVFVLIFTIILPVFHLSYHTNDPVRQSSQPKPPSSNDIIEMAPPLQSANPIGVSDTHIYL